MGLNALGQGIERANRNRNEREIPANWKTYWHNDICTFVFFHQPGYYFLYWNTYWCQIWSLNSKTGKLKSKINEMASKIQVPQEYRCKFCAPTGAHCTVGHSKYCFWFVANGKPLDPIKLLEWSSAHHSLLPISKQICLLRPRWLGRLVIGSWWLYAEEYIHRKKGTRSNAV